jgi:hypothetical protein
MQFFIAFRKPSDGILTFVDAESVEAAIGDAPPARPAHERVINRENNRQGNRP